MWENMGVIAERLTQLLQWKERCQKESKAIEEEGNRLQEQQKAMEEMEQALKKSAEELAQLHEHMSLRQRELAEQDLERLQQNLEGVTEVYKTWEALEKMYQGLVCCSRNRNGNRRRYLPEKSRLPNWRKRWLYCSRSRRRFNSCYRDWKKPISWSVGGLLLICVLLCNRISLVRYAALRIILMPREWRMYCCPLRKSWTSAGKGWNS